jgi:hypothetical protein
MIKFMSNPFKIALQMDLSELMIGLRKGYRVWQGGMYDLKKTVTYSLLRETQVIFFQCVAWMLPLQTITKIKEKRNIAPRSLDLSTCDYFLWGCLKARVYINKNTMNLKP